MSYDLAVWYRSKAMSRNKAKTFYAALCKGNTSGIEANRAVADFLKEITAKYPQIDDVPEENIAGCPWNSTFDHSKGHVILCIAWSRDKEVAPWVMDVAARHRLICYDPQSDTVHLPLGISGSKRWWQFWK